MRRGKHECISLPMEVYLSKSNSQSLFVAIGCVTYIYVQNSCLRTDMSFVGSDMGTVDRHAVLQRPSFGIVLILVRYHMSLTLTSIKYLKLCHLWCLVSIDSSDDMHLRVTIAIERGHSVA
jgi:hypothetical protein